MDKKSVYLNQRIKKETVKRLRKYERDNKLRSSISGTIEHLLNSQTNEQVS
jgi:predicted component of type VI protein secretion system